MPCPVLFGVNHDHCRTQASGGRVAAVADGIRDGIAKATFAAGERCRGIWRRRKPIASTAHRAPRAGWSLGTESGFVRAERRKRHHGEAPRMDLSVAPARDSSEIVEPAVAAAGSCYRRRKEPASVHSARTAWPERPAPWLGSASRRCGSLTRDADLASAPPGLPRSAFPKPERIYERVRSRTKIREHTASATIAGRTPASPPR